MIRTFLILYAVLAVLVLALYLPASPPLAWNQKPFAVYYRFYQPQEQVTEQLFGTPGAQDAADAEVYELAHAALLDLGLRFPPGSSHATPLAAGWLEDPPEAGGFVFHMTNTAANHRKFQKRLAQLTPEPGAGSIWPEVLESEITMNLQMDIGDRRLGVIESHEVSFNLHKQQRINHLHETEIHLFTPTAAPRDTYPLIRRGILLHPGCRALPIFLALALIPALLVAALWRPLLRALRLGKTAPTSAKPQT